MFCADDASYFERIHALFITTLGGAYMSVLANYIFILLFIF